MRGPYLARWNAEFWINHFARFGSDAFDYTWRLMRMAGVGKKFEFHGSFLSKADAVKKEQEVGGFIRERKIGGKVRYFVLTGKEK